MLSRAIANHDLFCTSGRIAQAFIGYGFDFLRKYLIENQYHTTILAYCMKPLLA